MQPEKDLKTGEGGGDAAFPFSVHAALLALAALAFGSSVQLPLAILRAAGFAVAALALAASFRKPLALSWHDAAVLAFAVFCLGHAFSSAYAWASLQHGFNVALAAALLFTARRPFLRRPERTWDAALASLAALAGLLAAVALLQRAAGGASRPAATFDNPNYLAEFLAVAGIVLLSDALHREGGGRRVLQGTCGALVLGAGVALPASRGVMAAVVPAAAWLLLWSPPERRGRLLLAALPVAAAAVVGAAWRFSEADVYAYGRIAIWKAALGTFADHPLGVGLGGFRFFWFARQSPFEEAFRRFGKHATTAHNEYLEVLSGLGIAGFLLFAAVLALPLVLAVRARNGFDPRRRGIAAAASAGLVLSGAHAAFNANFHNMGIVVLDATLLAALLAVLPEPLRSAPRLAVPGWAKAAGIALCAALLLSSLATYAASWAFDRAGSSRRAGRTADGEAWLLRAEAADPLRASIPDALAGLSYSRYRGSAADPAGREGAGRHLDEAVAREARAVALSPLETKYLLRLSRLSFERFLREGREDDLGAAFGAAGTALAVDPWSVEGLWQRAGMHEAAGRRDLAAADLEAAVSAEPNFCRGYGRLAALAGGAPATAARWREKESDCLKKAPPPSDEVWEGWFLDRPEGR